MKSPEIKQYWSSDIENLDDWAPDDSQHVDIWFSVAIGIKGEVGADNFQVHLVSQNQLSQVENKEYLLVIPYYETWTNVMEHLNRAIQACKDISWAGMSSQLEKLFLWEYHNYKP